MIIIGVDFHPGSQQIASVDTDTGEFEEKRLAHREEAEKFYRDLASRGAQIRVGREASGYARWFERLLAELQIELWIGDAAEIERKRARKQKTDREDAQHILQLMLKDDFPQIWVASGRTGICGNCCGIATAWCKRGPASGTNCRRGTQRRPAG